MDDRRKFGRKYLNFFTRIFNQSNGDLLGHLGDITAAGMMVISNQPIKLGQQFHLRVELPKSVFGMEHLDVIASSVWSQPDVTPEFYNTGFEFIDISPEEVEIIERIVKEYSIRG
jgi:hypothetical protein